LLCGVQAVELRAKLIGGSYDARTILSPATAPLYEAARAAAAGPPDPARPLHWNDLDEFLQPKVEGLLADIQARGAVFAALAPVQAAMRDFAGSLG
jgi:phenylalanine ammonia-lyase